MILALAFVPNPLFDVAGYLAGTGRMRAAEFLAWCAAGKVPKMILFAFAGASSSGLLTAILGTK